MTAKPLKKGATYDDLRDVPDNFVAEMFDGELYASPRPASPHTNAASVLCGKLNSQFHRPGAGGWVIWVEPELHFGNDVLVPDLAGRRRERLPTLPTDAYLTLAPDWVSEIPSPSTEALDRGKKLQRYAREGVGHVCSSSRRSKRSRCGRSCRDGGTDSLCTKAALQCVCRRSMPSSSS